MKAKTLEALKGSIEKWKKIVAGTGKDRAVLNCPLCQLFWSSSLQCEGCPVAEKTRRAFCAGTPYQEWDRAHRDRSSGFPYIAETAAERKLARAELRFLKSLLPKKGRKS